MKNVVTLVLGGGRGTRLYPLTKFRSKPAVPLAGKYRLIDIPLSNCINSGLNRIYVLTQFMSVSLHRHIRRTYNFDAFDGGFVEVLAAQQTLESNDWFQGTADAVRQHMGYIRGSDVQHVLILSGDQLYRMNFEKMLAEHRESGADVSIAAMPVDSSQASGLGVMRADDTGRVTGFLEKPKTQQEIDMVRVDPAWIDRQGVESKGRDCLASMGIYLFNRDVLVESLEKTDYQDFGKEIFPASIRSRHVHMHLFDDYWEDIGTIDAFYEANLALTRPDPPFHMAEADAPIYTRARFLPPSRVDGATVTGSLIGDGCTIGRGAVIENSVIGVRSHIGADCVIRNSVLMGADFYEKASDDASQIPLGVGPRTVIEGAIIDKNCRIGADCRITKNADVAEKDELDGWMIRDGILVTVKNAEFPNGYHTN